jgi:hypothetical protein
MNSPPMTPRIASGPPALSPMCRSVHIVYEAVRAGAAIQGCVIAWDNSGYWSEELGRARPKS